MRPVDNWPKITWRIRRNRDVNCLVITGQTLANDKQFAVDQAISFTEINAIRLPFSFLRHRAMRYIRGLFAHELEKR